MSSVTIDCFNSSAGSSTAAPQRVEWRSIAWSTSHDPLVIFRRSGDDNRNFDVNSEHPNAGNYAVDRQYRLTISGVDKGTDPDTYICSVTTSSGDEREHQYILIVAGQCRAC